MKAIDAAEFEAWLADAGIVSHAKYSSVVFDGGDDHARFWCRPKDAAAERIFYGTLLDIFAGPAGTVLVRPRDRSWWAFADDEDGALPPDSPVRTLVQADDTRAVAFEAADRGALLDLLGHVSEVGWNCGHDVYLIPDGRAAFGFVSHHKVVHVDARDAATLDAIIERLAAAGYHLPTELPDETFKRPAWMKAPP